MEKKLLQKKETSGTSVLESLIVARHNDVWKRLSEMETKQNTSLSFLHEEISKLNKQLSDIKVLLQYATNGAKNTSDTSNKSNVSNQSNVIPTTTVTRELSQSAGNSAVDINRIVQSINDAKIAHQNGKAVLEKLFDTYKSFSDENDFTLKLKVVWKSWQNYDGLIARRVINTFCKVAYQSYCDLPQTTKTNSKPNVLDGIDFKAKAIAGYSKSLHIDSEDILSAINQIREDRSDWINGDGKLNSDAITQLTDIWELSKYPKRETESFFRFLEEQSR